jgi:hypothetical protein
MGKLFGIVLLTAMLLFPASVSSVEPSAMNAKAGYTIVQSTQTQAVSGQIAAIQGNMFTLAVRDNPSHALRLQERQAKSTMTFLINNSTSVEGNLQTGADADVLYRQEGGNNIAISVRVTNRS